MQRPRLLDLFCGAGGASVGYHRAGFDVVGVDIRPQPRYPFDFVQADAIGGRWWRHFQPSRWAAIHASPPCQAYSTATKRNGTQANHPDLIAPVRELVRATGLPYVIENVIGAPLVSPAEVCGSAFDELTVDGFRLRRHRLFESSFPLHGTPCYCHAYRSTPVIDVSGGGPTHRQRTDTGGGRPYKGTADQVRRIMGMPWATKAECNEAIPPAYTEFVGEQLLAHLHHKTAA